MESFLLMPDGKPDACPSCLSEVFDSGYVYPDMLLEDEDLQYLENTEETTEEKDNECS